MDLSQFLVFDLNYYSSEARSFFSSKSNYSSLKFKKSNVFYGIEEFERDNCLNNPIFRVRRDLEFNLNKFSQN